MNEINKYIEIGLVNSLKVDSKNEYGYILKATEGDKEAYLITEDNFTLGDLIDVFIYTSSKSKLHAVLQRPNTLRDQYNIFEVKEIMEDGVFVNWGISKDLYVPNKHQNGKFRFGENRILKVIYDRDLNQLVGTEVFHKSLIKRTKELKKSQSINFMVLSKVPHGYKLIVENRYEAVILAEDMEDKIFRIGMKFSGIVRMIKEDGSILVKFKQRISKKRSNISNHIMKILEKNSGVLNYGLKSTPEEIKNIFDLSKKSFKTSVLALKVDNEIELFDYLIKIK